MYSCGAPCPVNTQKGVTMSDRYAHDFVPWTDASNAPSRLSQWWALPDAVAEARADLANIAAAGDPFSTAWPFRALRWSRGLARRVWSRSEGDTKDELFAFARSVEGSMPNLAAELRFIAVHRPNAPD